MRLPYFLLFCQFSFTSAWLLKMCTCILCRCYFTVCTSLWRHSSLIEPLLWNKPIESRWNQSVQLYTKTGSAISIDFRPENVAVCHIFTSLSNVSVNSKPDYLSRANVLKGRIPHLRTPRKCKPPGQKNHAKTPLPGQLFSEIQQQKNSTEWNAN